MVNALPPPPKQKSQKHASLLGIETLMMDFLSDYNFQLDNHGHCALVAGLQPVSRAKWCLDNPDAVEYYPPSGYRRIPLTTCDGGLEMDKQAEPQSCPDKEDEFQRLHRASGWSIFFAVLIPVGLASGVGYWVWKKWDGKFGQIRLGENNGFDTESPWVKYPVIFAAGTVAVVATLPSAAKAVWRSGKAALERWGVLDSFSGGAYGWVPGGGGRPRRFTSRASFQRGRADYAIVDEDEGELLGDDSDHDV